MKLTSSIIKVLLMHKYRYKDGYYVSSEVDICGSFGSIADLGIFDSKKKDFFEIEIKISRSDLKKDILKDKHRAYKSGNRYLCISRFYYAVPTSLVNDAKELLEEHSLPYGIIEIISNKDQISDSILEELSTRRMVYSKYIKIIKRSKNITCKNISPLQEQKFYLRLSSEMVSSTRKLLEMNVKEISC